MIKVGPVYAFSWLCQSYARTFLVIFSTASKRRRAPCAVRRGPWPVALVPCAVCRVPPDRPCANLSHAAVTRYISAWSGDAWRVRALVRSGAILPLPHPIFRRESAQVRPVYAQALPPRDNNELAPASDAIITHQTAQKICTKSST